MASDVWGHGREAGNGWAGNVQHHIQALQWNFECLQFVSHIQPFKFLQVLSARSPG